MNANPFPGVSAEGAVVTYLLVTDMSGAPVRFGTFPHVPMWNAIPFVSQCEATITITDDGGDHPDRCTRERSHKGAHVVHLRRGLPTVAWLVTGSGVPS